MDENGPCDRNRCKDNSRISSSKQLGCCLCLFSDIRGKSTSRKDSSWCGWNWNVGKFTYKCWAYERIQSLWLKSQTAAGKCTVQKLVQTGLECVTANVWASPTESCGTAKYKVLCEGQRAQRAETRILQGLGEHVTHFLTAMYDQAASPLWWVGGICLHCWWEGQGLTTTS